MKLFPIVCLLAVAAAGEVLGEICNFQRTPTNLIARRTWPGETSTTTTTAKPTTVTITSSPSTTTPTTTTALPVLLSCSISHPGNQGESCATMCPDATSAGSGVVQSPHFPGDYGDGNMECYATITAPEGWLIQLNFTTFNLEMDEGTVFVENSWGHIMLDYTTGNTIPDALVALNNIMKVTFYSTRPRPVNGVYNFQATYTAVKPA